MKILGIETSCDETAAAVVEDGKKILTNVVASSAGMHQKYGGIVPEVAARKQVDSMIPVLTEVLQSRISLRETMAGITKDDIDAIAVTVGPGLIGSLLVGVETAKTLAFTWNKPVIPVNHVLAHIYAVFQDNDDRYSSSEPQLRREVTNSHPWLDRGSIDSRFRGNDNKVSSRSTSWRTSNKKISFPAIALVVSGGHTELYLMKDEKTLKWLGGTLDDAAGECFDKTARLLGLPYPGGPQIQRFAEKYLLSHNSPNSPSYLKRGLGGVTLPRPMIHDESLNFSFSGLKTAVHREFNKLKTMKQFNNLTIQQFSHEIQESITDVLVSKTLKAASEQKARSIIVTGGVAANQRLSQKFNLTIQQFNLPAQAGNSTIELFVPPPNLCVDSATYIAAYAFYHNQPIDWKSIEAKPNLSVEVLLI